MLHPRFIRPYLKEVGVIILGATIMCFNDQAHNKDILIVCVHIYLHEHKSYLTELDIDFSKIVPGAISCHSANERSKFLMTEENSQAL